MTVRLSVEYRGYPDDRDAVILDCAQTAHAVWSGAGYCFLDGTRDVSLICMNKRHAEYMAGMLKSNLSDVTIALWE